MPTLFGAATRRVLAATHILGSRHQHLVIKDRSACLRCPVRAMSDDKGKLQEYSFEITHEEVAHKRYLTLYNRRIRFPAYADKPAQEHEYDIIGHPQLNFSFVVVFPFHPYTDGRRGGQVTLVREHCQGPNAMLWTLPTGGNDPRKSASFLAAAQAELSEEAKPFLLPYPFLQVQAHLSGGEWIELLEPEHPGIAEVKWCRNRFRPFLCIDPQKDESPGQRDAEEFIEVHRVDMGELRRMLTGADMLLPSITTAFLAFDKLQSLGRLA